MGRQDASLAAATVDCQMSDQAAGYRLVLQRKDRAHFKAAGIQALGIQLHVQLIAAMDGPQEVGVTVHYRQGHLGGMRLVAAAGKHTPCCQSVALETVLPRFVAPAQQLVEMHHTGCIGVAKAHIAFQFEPVVAVQNVASQL